MADLSTIQRLYRGDSSRPLSVRASGSGYDAAGTGIRSRGWQPPRLGASTLLLSSLDQIWARSHDAIRNNAWAASAIDKFESNVIGAGIQPHWQHPNENIRLRIQKAFTRWSRQSDFEGQSDFFGIQALMARALFEGGEVFCRYHVRPPKDRLFVPLQLQLIEGEQVPIWKNQGLTDTVNAIRMGIEFDKDQRRTAYHMYRENPGESMFFPSSAMQFVRIPATEVRHIFKPLRVGQLRGQPKLTPVLALIYDLEKYTDAELLRKQVSAMFAGFIQRPTPDGQILPPAPPSAGSSGHEQSVDPASFGDPGPGIDIARMEPGTLQVLFPGEEISFPTVPDSPDFATFVSVQLHKFAAGIGMTYEQCSTDLRGVSFSSIRAGLNEFQRACEQYQYLVMVQQGCEPIKNRWLKEAVLCGAIELPDDYFDDPSPYEECVWVPPGWQYVNPLQEIQAKQLSVRGGFTSRTGEVRQTGLDPDVVDAQQATERARAASLGIIYDSDPNKVLIGRETQPETPTNAKPNRESEEERDVDDPEGASSVAPFAHGLGVRRVSRPRRVQ